MSSGATSAVPASAAGEDLFVEAVKVSLAEGSGTSAMPLFQKALALGLPPRDQEFRRTYA